MKAADVGKKGEALAAEWYLAAGYRVLQRNFRCRLGEIDLVCEKDDVLVFAEVKTRTGSALDRPGAWVDKVKQRKLLNAARQYLYANNLNEPYTRFDVVEVLLNSDGAYRIEVTENAFEA